MINSIKTLFNRISNLENTVASLTKSTTVTESNTNCVTFTKNLLNFSILSKTKVLIAKIDVIQNSNLYFQDLIELNLSASQKVTFSLIVDDISIYKSTRELSSGFNQITIMKTYSPLSSKTIEIYLEITPAEEKQIILIGESLFVWGIYERHDDIQYQAIELEDEFLLAYQNNNSIYYLLKEKNTSSNNAEDFSFYKSAKSFSFAYLEDQGILYLFRVDTDGNLFYSNFENKNETFLESDVSYVSCSCSSDTILVTFIQNNLCYFLTFDGNIFSNSKQINYSKSLLEKCFTFYNKYSNKYYIIMSDKNNSNYIVESQNELFDGKSYLNASLSLKIETYGEE